MAQKSLETKFSPLSLVASRDMDAMFWLCYKKCIITSTQLNISLMYLSMPLLENRLSKLNLAVLNAYCVTHLMHV